LYSSGWGKDVVSRTSKARAGKMDGCQFVLWKGKGHMAQLPKDQHITYQLQYRKCGKPSCKTCREGKGHGPYWYAYWREGSRLRSGYVGKAPPDSITGSKNTSTDASMSSQNDGTMPVSNEEDDTRGAQRATA
jgi:hypothetical protein